METTNRKLLSEIEELKAKVEQLQGREFSLLKENEFLKAIVKGRTHDLLLSIEQFKVLADNIPVIVWTANPDGEVDYYNQQYVNYTGKALNESKGWEWRVMLHPEDLDRTIATWKKSIATGVEYEIQYRFKRASDNEYRWHLVKAIPLKNDEGKVIKWFGTNTDIHEQKEAEKKKDEFLSIASHELKTPLTSVKAFIQLSKTRLNDSEPVYHFIDKAGKQLYRLEKLISDLLDVSKINAGRMVYNVEEFNFKDALKEIVESVQQTSETHKIIVEHSEDIIYKGDKLRIEQVIDNLLTNAIKYSPDADKVIVRSEVQQESIIVSIQDFGIGIPPENLNNLFERFYRIDNTAMRFQGLGLGLYIASEIVKRHNGSFWIESELDKGSTFYFLLPIKGKYELLDLSTDHQTHYKGNFIEMYYNEQKRWLEVDWMGYQNFDSVKKGCMIMLDLLKKNNCSKVLNDNTHVMGNWSEAADWGGEFWFPAMENAGLKYFAWIYSPSTFSRMSAKKSIDIMLGNITAQFFIDKNEAITWLEEIN